MRIRTRPAALSRCSTCSSSAISVFAKDGLWEKGHIYDPENGKDYKCKMTLASADVLRVRGFIGISLIGRTEVWTRVK